MSLENQPILIFDDCTDGFAQEQRTTLSAAGGEPMVALDEREALEQLKQFEFSVVLVRHPPRYSKHLVDAFSGVPVVFYGGPLSEPDSSLPTDPTEILRRLEMVLDAE